MSLIPCYHLDHCKRNKMDRWVEFIQAYMIAHKTIFKDIGNGWGISHFTVLTNREGQRLRLSACSENSLNSNSELCIKNHNKYSN